MNENLPWTKIEKAKILAYAFFFLFCMIFRFPKHLKLIYRVLMFTNLRHGEIAQRRKYTKEPYIFHPLAVAFRVAFLKNSSIEMVCAAISHDLAEDTNATLEEIGNLFGHEIYVLVENMTNVSKLSDGNRAVRAAIDCEHTKNSTINGKTIKLADIEHNFKSIVKCDERFARRWVPEKYTQALVCKGGNENLYQKVTSDLQQWIHSNLSAR